MNLLHMKKVKLKGLQNPIKEQINKKYNLINVNNVNKNIFKNSYKSSLKSKLFSIFLIILGICFFTVKIIRNNYLSKKNIEINEPILPKSNKEYIVKKYIISSSNFNNSRYYFKNYLFEQRKIFKINYSYYPYLQINKLLSYEENANNIYNSTGMLNITKLDFYYNNTDINTLNFNHIHLSMGFDEKYIDLSLVSIASILNVSSPDTYIHFHILVINFKFESMRKIIQLKRINKNVDFVFYNSKQAEYDFGERGKKEWRGVGDYTRILISEIVNNTNKILIMDSGDIIAQKDLSEIYYYDLGDNYFSWILEDVAGNHEVNWNKFFRNYFYPNSGVCLVNIRLWRKDGLYKKAYLISKSYKDFPCPFQDILFVISDYRFLYFPLKYNCKQFFDNDEQMKNKDTNTTLIKKWTNHQRFSPYKYSIEEILEASLDPVINHFYQDKITNCNGCNYYTKQWIKYAELTGFYENIKRKYPKPFNICKIVR